LSGRLSRSPKCKLTEKDIADTFKYVAKVRQDCSAKFNRVG
jgi:hypothetical protein